MFYASHITAIAHIIHAFLAFTSTRLCSVVSCPRTLPRKKPSEDLVRLEPRTPGLRVKHLTIEPRGTLAISILKLQLQTQFLRKTSLYQTVWIRAQNACSLRTDLDLHSSLKVIYSRLTAPCLRLNQIESIRRTELVVMLGFGS